MNVIIVLGIVFIMIILLSTTEPLVYDGHCVIQVANCKARNTNNNSVCDICPGTDPLRDQKLETNPYFLNKGTPPGLGGCTLKLEYPNVEGPNTSPFFTGLTGTWNDIIGNCDTGCGEGFTCNRVSYEQLDSSDWTGYRCRVNQRVCQTTVGALNQRIRDNLPIGTPNRRILPRDYNMQQIDLPSDWLIKGFTQADFKDRCIDLYCQQVDCGGTGLFR